MGTENKGFFFLTVRKFKKMTVFDSWTFELAQRLGNKRKSRLFRRLVSSGRKDRIRTDDPYVPNVVLYQAEPPSD